MRIIGLFRRVAILVLVAAAAADDVSLAERTGSFFAPPPQSVSAAPDVTVVRLPEIAGAHAIWGATGRDRRGHIWFGVSMEGSGSAHLCEYDPEAKRVFDRGDVVTALGNAGVKRRLDSQAKLHTRIVHADDGHLYFASMDEQGESLAGGLPMFGGHMWRLQLKTGRWEHLFATPEALIAVTAGGRWIYALGYWDHVLYQYDTVTGKHRSLRVGSAGGHVSRNVIGAPDGHVFVPRVRKEEDGSSATLVELEPRGLTEVAAFPLLDGYLGKQLDESHGITGFTYLANGSIAFTTGEGALFRIDRPAGKPTKITALGDFHPSGPCYPPSLFSYAGRRYLVGAASQPGRAWRWIIYDLETDECVERHLEFEPRRKNLFLYGSITRDSRGRFYLGGFDEDGPVLAAVDPGK